MRSEEDRATATGNTYSNLVKWDVFLSYASGQTNKQRDMLSQNFTTLPEVLVLNK